MSYVAIQSPTLALNVCWVKKICQTTNRYSILNNILNLNKQPFDESDILSQNK